MARKPIDSADLELFAAFEEAGYGARSAVARLIGTSPQFITHFINGRAGRVEAQRRRILDALDAYVASKDGR